MVSPDSANPGKTCVARPDPDEIDMRLPVIYNGAVRWFIDKALRLK